jgi:DMSO/TMAO reductase YedYZ molybdopterin-dependent catalytic subunit
MSTSEDEAACPAGPESDSQPPAKEGPDDLDIELTFDNATRRLRSLSRRGFAVAGLAALGGLAGWRWLSTQGDDNEIPWPLRRVLELNERLARAAFSESRRSPNFVRAIAQTPRVNGSYGLTTPLDPAAWRLRVLRSGDVDNPQYFTLDEIKTLRRFELTTELRCIEGWSTVVHWAGARFADLAAIIGLAARKGQMARNGRARARGYEYVSLETPDGEYYVGLDMDSAVHPQTLLCYEMGGLPLTSEHGAPLRLVTPVKYGIKSIKRIGTIRFTDDRPADYWAERGYDWYAGH